VLTGDYFFTDKDDAILVQQFWEFGVLRGMPPAGPHRLDLRPLGYVQDQLNIGVVVVIGTARHRHVLIGQPDIFCSQSQHMVNIININIDYNFVRFTTAS